MLQVISLITWLRKIYLKTGNGLIRRDSQQAKIFSRLFFFATASVAFLSCVYNCDDHPSFNSSLCSSHLWFSYIHTDFIITLSWVYNEPIQRPAPSWLVGLIGRGCTGIAQDKGSCTSQYFFFQAFFSLLLLSYIYNFDGHPSFNSSLRSSHTWFSYIHNFRTAFNTSNREVERSSRKN